ncbi:hypothetical protein QAD02_018042 [Eretmocerus hayati]|uniref:Uncharacterized protein n=1 Tax=Eretmocerus hayati TaxID=131215 RepID=A0ACC2PFP7_9HYME|nr:hypothetical protein QAD02_018042 [Eretmocerus hayati]
MKRPLEEGCDCPRVTNAVTLIKRPAFPRTLLVFGTPLKKNNRVAFVMPHNARRWLPGAPGGWFPSPDAVAESSDSEDVTSSREPSPKRPCRASTELDYTCPQGSGPSSSASLVLREEPAVSPPHVIARTEAWTQTCGAAAMTMASTVSSDEPPSTSHNRTQPRSEFESHAPPNHGARTPAQESAPMGPMMQPPQEDGSRAGPASLPPPASVSPLLPSRPIQRCLPRVVPCVDLGESDNGDEVRVLYERLAAPNRDDMSRIIRFKYELFRELVNEYEATLNPRVGARIRLMTSVQDARTQHRELMRRRRAERRAQENEQLQFIANIAGDALEQPLIIAQGPRQQPGARAPDIVDIPARAIANAPTQQVNMAEIMGQLPPMEVEQPQVQYLREQPAPAAEEAAAERQVVAAEAAPRAPPMEVLEDAAVVDPAPRAAARENEGGPLDLSVRVAAEVAPGAEIYELQPAPRAREGGRPGLRFVPDDEMQRLNDPIWRDIAGFVRGIVAAPDAE